ncbi:leucine--tRNA ligase [Candidatus Saccharibacteria bacterium]|nr:leucine--tRNA ligase [Candidatus Saccharibacteria bacterium]
MDRYNPQKIEQKWQEKWEKEHTFAAAKGDKNLPENLDTPKVFIAEMFPYPSGAGLHVGHVRNFTIVDVLARFYSQQQMNVLRPFGYDTFGLPAENYAIKTGTSPKEATKTNINNFRKQMKRLGNFVDWSREINTSDPEYYRWTQWCFLQLYKKGLAYRKESYQWWCPVDQTVLANEQVENGCCWRCGHEVEKKKMKQWFFKITDYADELLQDVDALDWPEKIKTMQKNWIGRSEGAEIEFEVASKSVISNGLDGVTAAGSPEAELQRGLEGKQLAGPQTPVAIEPTCKIKVFTTIPDTLFGATFLVLAPEHPIIPKIADKNVIQKIDQYRTETLKKSEIERQENKEKTGVFTGAYAINPATGEKIPIWVSDYVLMGYGEGAIMAVPAHDERDLAFAEKFDLPVKEVIEKPENSTDSDRCYHGDGVLINSENFDGKQSSDARELIVSWLEEQGIGRKKVTYKMRDWLISRQRYWGCPIPIAYDEDGNEYPIPEDQLPVIIPEVEDYKPDNTGRSALAKATDWLHFDMEVDEDGKKVIKHMTRETDTLDGYACSSWYLWRYVSPHDKNHAWDEEAIKYWAPTDVYVGSDHAVAHLLYIRFGCKFFADLGYLPFREPVKTLLYNGYINAPDGKKMSKSKGNVIDPLDIIDQGYGADTLRTYEMFIGPYDQDAAWDPKSVGGVYRFLNRCWNLCFKEAGKQQFSPTSAVATRTGDDESSDSSSSEHLATTGAFLRSEPRNDGSEQASERGETNTTFVRNRTIKKVTEDLHRHNFNTAVSAMMEYVNELYKVGASDDDIITLARLLKPFAPHLASEMLEKFGADDVWPVWDEKYLVEDTVEVVVQVNGKLRAKLKVAASDLEDQAKIEKLALDDKNVQNFTKGGIKKTIYVKKAKLLNLVA